MLIDEYKYNEYKILGNPQKDVYAIQTQFWGIVNIYVPKDGDSEFYSKEASNLKQQQSNRQYLNLNPKANNWRVYPMNVAPIMGNEVDFYHLQDMVAYHMKY